MKITPAAMPAHTDTRPTVERPVRVDMDCRLYYLTERGPTDWAHPIWCSEAYADLVLPVLNAWAKGYGFGIVHLGIYNARMARKPDGRPITPPRWSNHAYGEAMDFAGIVTAEGHFLTVAEMEKDCPAKLAELLEKVRKSITGAHRKPEIVNECHKWIHLGIYPKGDD